MSAAAPLTVSVTDYWTDLDPRAEPLLRLILSSCDSVFVEDPKDADLVLFSVFGRRSTVAKGTRLGFSGEPRLALGGEWSLDWRHVGSQQHLRFPYWVHHMLNYHPSFDHPVPGAGSRFCNFVYSNHACGMRNAFFTMLSRERHVDAPGRVFNNTTSELLGARTDPAWPTKKVAALSDHRFTIAFENEEHVGYTTEKIVDAWLAGSVPIYWGNPAIEADFAAGSYLSYYEAGSLGALVRDVLGADDDRQRYAAMTARNPFRTGELRGSLDRHVAELEAFIGRVIEDVVAHRGAPRRSAAVRSAAQARLSYAGLRRRAVGALLRR